SHYWAPRLYVYENREALPWFLLAKQVHVVGSKAQVLNAIAGSSAADLGSNVWMESGDAQEMSTADLQSGAGTIALERYGADEIKLDVNVTSPAMMVITNNYNPYWKAWIDGRPVKIIPADHTFQGVRLETGRHRMLLKYAAPLL
ncbi:MAG: YfhO family protein, partial [Candidatus Angelobacter sp.]